MMIDEYTKQDKEIPEDGLLRLFFKGFRACKTGFSMTILSGFHLLFILS